MTVKKNREDFVCVKSHSTHMALAASTVQSHSWKKSIDPVGTNRMSVIEQKEDVEVEILRNIDIEVCMMPSFYSQTLWAYYLMDWNKFAHQSSPLQLEVCKLTGLVYWWFNCKLYNVFRWRKKRTAANGSIASRPMGSEKRRFRLSCMRTNKNFFLALVILNRLSHPPTREGSNILMIELWCQHWYLLLHRLGWPNLWGYIRW